MKRTAHSVHKEAAVLRGLLRAVGRIEVAEDQLSDRRQSVLSPSWLLLGAGPLAGEAPYPVIRAMV